MTEPSSVPEARMNDLEALMWTLEKDPHLSSWVGNLTILDREPELAALRSRLGEAAMAIPRLRQQVAPTMGRLAPPEWRDDPDFDVARHVRTVGVPAPGDEAALLALVTELNDLPLDRTRPLWEFTVITGLAGGRAAMLQRLHHAITDGEGGVAMAAQYVDLERDAAQPMTPPVPVETPTVPQRDLAGLALETVRHSTSRLAGAAERIARDGAGLLVAPGRWTQAVRDASALVGSVQRQLSADHARSPLWTERSLRRSIAILQVPFRPAKAASRRMGGSLNDFFVTGAATGIGAYHRAKGVEVDELRMAMPVSTRTGGTAGNAFAPTRVLVPVSPADPAERFAEVSARLRSTKGEPAIGAVASIAGIANLLPTALLVRVARGQTETVDFATSNVRGAPFPTFIAGAEMLANYPLGPVAGTAVNITTLSHNGSLDIGIHADAAAVDDVVLLRSCLEDAYAELIDAG